MKISKSIFCAIVLLCTGCANMMTLDRTTVFPAQKKKDPTKASGVAIHLDAPQRLVYSGPDGDICAEPSPDALQAYAASFGASLSLPDSKSAALANALSGDAAGIGLRTQAITLMRDHLYRICEARHNGSLNKPDVMQLLERSQDLTLGILAIEQLTGAVVARQPVLTMGANADASANVNNTQKALDQAKKDEADKKDAIPPLQEAQVKAQAAVDEVAKQKTEAEAKAATEIALVGKLKPDQAKNQTKLQGTFDTLIAARKDQALQKATVVGLQTQLDEAKEAKNQSKIDELQKQIDSEQKKLNQFDTVVAAAKNANDDQQATVDRLTAAMKAQTDTDAYKNYDAISKDLASKQDDLQKAKDAVTNAGKAYEQAQKVTQSTQQNLDAAIATNQAITKGEGLFAQATDRNNISKDTVKEISSATQAIVSTIVSKGHLTDTCANIITEAVSNYSKDPIQQALLNQYLPLCKEVFDADIEAYKKQIDKGKPPPPPMLQTQ